MIKNEYFPESRERHCYNVGLLMYSYAKNVYQWPEDKCRSMFILGKSHDQGYELNKDPFLHDEAMCEALGQDGYVYANEIKYHSKLQDKYDSPELRLLYFADACIDGMGNWCTFTERLDDILKRHGETSEVYIESVKIAHKCVKEWGFRDNILPNIFISRISDPIREAAITDDMRKALEETPNKIFKSTEALVEEI